MAILKTKKRFRSKMEAGQAVWFENEFRCILEQVKNQRVGTGKDYKITSLCLDSALPKSDLNKFIEFKFDKACRKTGNLYLEYEQTFDFGVKYQPSGMILAIEQSKFIVFSVKYIGCIHHYVFTGEEMRELLKRKMRSVRTRDNANGNRDGCWTNGFLMPVKSIPVKFRQIERISGHTSP